MKFTRIATTAILAAAVIFTLSFGMGKIGEGVTVKNSAPEKTIITVWQVDTFEGGSGSRQRFLSDAARAFEKRNDGVLITVTSYTPAGVKENFAAGVKPDLISYGGGVETGGLAEINVRGEGAEEKEKEKRFAAAWCRGVYALFENPAALKKEYETLTVSAGEYTLPLVALALEERSDYFSLTEKAEELPPLDAYIKFVSGKSKYLLGTQRDAVRLKNRGFSAKITPLSRFSDLNQYISITSTDALKTVYAERFVEYVLSDEVQKKLNGINMFSPYLKTGYDDADFCAMAAVEPEKTLSPFTGAAELGELRELSRAAARGDGESLLKIKKVLL